MITKNKKQLNLSAYFMLPLLKLNVDSFGGVDNIENVYITTSMQIVVKIKNPNLAYDYTSNPDVMDYDEDGFTFIVYQLGDEWGDDFLYYTKGMYSKMTLFAKDLIKKNSTLEYNKKIGTKPIYDSKGKYLRTDDLIAIHPALRALDKDPYLREYHEEYLDVKIDPTSELWDKIDDREYIRL